MDTDTIPADYKIGRATELVGTDRRIYRFFEMIPAFLSWGTVLGAIIASYFIPLYAAIFIIAFDIYWFLKTVFLSVHLRKNWKRTKKALSTDWRRLLGALPHDHLYHMVILPFYKEDYTVISKSIDSLCQANISPDRLIVVLAAEERAGQSAHEKAERAHREYGPRLGRLFV